MGNRGLDHRLAGAHLVRCVRGHRPPGRRSGWPDRWRSARAAALVTTGRRLARTARAMPPTGCDGAVHAGDQQHAVVALQNLVHQTIKPLFATHDDAQLQSAQMRFSRRVGRR